MDILTAKNFIISKFLNNKQLSENNELPVAYNLVGERGLGKTSIFKAAAKELVEKYGMEVELVILRVAGMEAEDFLGNPEIKIELCDEKDNCFYVTEKSYDFFVSKGNKPTGNTSTINSFPEFIKDKPMLFVLDDSTRAVPQTQQALMSIILDQEFSNWELPKGSSVFLTNNPENKDYMVTSLDIAQLDRYITIPIEFKEEVFFQYAEGRFNDILLTFLHQNKEFISKDDKLINTPRALERFSNSIKYMDFNGKESFERIVMEAKYAFGVEFSSSLTSFKNGRLFNLPDVKKVLEPGFVEIYEYTIDDTRNDIESIFINRIVNFINNTRLKKKEAVMVALFLSSNVISKEFTNNIVKEIFKNEYNNQALINSGSSRIREIIDMAAKDAYDE